MVEWYRRAVIALLLNVFLVLTPLLMISTVQADEKTVLIVNVDETEQGELASKLYQTVVARISEHLERAGFQTLNDDTQLSREAGTSDSLSDTDLLSKLRAETEKSIDFVAIVQIFANTVLLSGGTRIEVEIAGRMLKVDNGDVLARFDLPVPNALNAPPACDRECIIQLLEDNTTFLANSLGQVLAKRLQSGQ